jgi:hypothetical protein
LGNSAPPPPASTGNCLKWRGRGMLSAPGSMITNTKP